MNIVEVLCTDDALVSAAGRCFAEPGPEAVAALEALLSPEPGELMRQCVVIIRTANAALDDEYRRLTGIFRQQGTVVVCAEGCAGCCHQMVLCQPFEAVAMHAYLAARPEAMQAFLAAHARWDAATASLRHSYLAWAERLYTHGEDTGEHSLEEYDVPCPLLDAANHCLVYPVRPYGCRTCIALDPACAVPACAEPGRTRGPRPHIHYSLFTPHHKARTEVTRLLLRRLGVEARPIPMPEMLAALCGA